MAWTQHSPTRTRSPAPRIDGEMNAEAIQTDFNQAQRYIPVPPLHILCDSIASIADN